ncbi:hypothetical protein I203_102969 [Kwoniella mangroviensis CBS 8507]|uniref:uncharacterized protein n=1 Tax=Kwoniella mangroviensis CBS 8507 TaxID=1296122 RepID=UPI00080CFAFB|nr:uncharacterized protein I203_03946 [Kwoniella mangroviensis CBS 8507]OCF67258.1 hypothetical protein I203_03946 [Kwoniella mangroviensis CBS 8507]
MGEQAEVRAAICSHVYRSKSAITSCLRQAIDTVKRSSLVASSDQSVQDAYNLYVEKILNVAVEPEKIWDDNHTVDQLLASEGSEYLNSLLNLQSSRSRNSSNKAVCPIPEASEGEDSAISTWIDGIKVLSKDVKSDTWPTTKTRPSQM